MKILVSHRKNGVDISLVGPQRENSSWVFVAVFRGDQHKTTSCEREGRSDQLEQGSHYRHAQRFYSFDTDANSP